MNRALIDRHSSVLADTQRLIIQLASDVGLDDRLSQEPISTKRYNATDMRYIFPEQFLPLYRACMTALYRASMTSLDAQSANAVPNCEEVELFCACLIHCENLEDVIVKAARFARFFNQRGESLSLEVVGDKAHLRMDTQKKNRTVPALICDLFGLSFLHKLFGWLIGEALEPSRIGVVYQPLISEHISEFIAGGPVQFESSANLLSFDKHLLRQPVIRTHKELLELIHAAPFELIALTPKIAVSSQLEQMFRKLLLEGGALPSLDQLAHRVGYTVSTLRRHLARDDTSYQEIVDRCRMQRALELLQTTAMTVDDIADHLGFSAASSFSRAFKDWTGESPSMFRQQSGEHRGDRVEH